MITPPYTHTQDKAKIAYNELGIGPMIVFISNHGSGNLSNQKKIFLKIKCWKTDAGQMKEYNHHNHVEKRIKSISYAVTTLGPTFSPCTLCPLTDIRTLVPKQWMHYMIVNETDITQLLFFFPKTEKKLKGLDNAVKVLHLTSMFHLNFKVNPIHRYIFYKFDLPFFISAIYSSFYGDTDVATQAI